MFLFLLKQKNLFKIYKFCLINIIYKKFNLTYKKNNVR